MCVQSAHIGTEWRELYELTHVQYYATIICRPSENETYVPVNNCGRIKTLCIRPLKENAESCG